MPETINETLAARGKRYGQFIDHATVTQQIKDLLRENMGLPKWERLADDQKEALEMIAHKLGRIVCGDPDYDDSWRDIAGYAQLVANRLAQTQPAPGHDGTECACAACNLRHNYLSHIEQIKSLAGEDIANSILKSLQAMHEAITARH